MEQSQTTTTETDETENLVPLTPHKYPLFLKFCAFILVFFSAFAYLDIPLFMELSALKKHADRALQLKNYNEAIELYSQLVKRFPGFTNNKMNLAKCYFGLNTIRGNYLAFKTLSKLPQEDMRLKKVLPIIPKEFHESFLKDFK